MKTSESAGGVVMNGDRVAVVRQRGRAWSLPKGHLEKGETALEAAVREIREECGITSLTVVRELGTYERHRIGKDPEMEDTRVLKRITMFLFTTDETELAPTDKKIKKARWVQKDDVTEFLSHPLDRQFYAGLNL